ncbi:hypothetical protein P9112_012246 [Eukaryota sp. TZLM1-RC]
MNAVFKTPYSDIYIDDLIVLAGTFEEFLTNLDRTLPRARNIRARLSGPKTVISDDSCSITILESDFHDGKRHISPSRTSAITPLPLPKYQKQLRAFLGSAIYYSEIKTAIENAVPLTLPEDNQQIVITTDASDVGIGGAIWADLSDNPNDAIPLEQRKLTPLSSFSRTLSKAQQWWSTNKKELYAIVATLSYSPLSNFLLGRPLLIYTDHKNLIFSKEVIENFLTAADQGCSGHLGPDRTIEYLESLGLTWPDIQKDVKLFIQHCGVCLKSAKTSKTKPAHTGSFYSSLPFESLHLDVICPLPKNNVNNRYILVMTDAFTRFTLLKPITFISAEATANTLVYRIFSIFGIPMNIRHNGGKEFANDIMKALLSKLNITSTITIPHHSPSNGLVERRNQKVLSLIRKLATESNNHRDWSSKLPLIQLILNSSPSTATGKYSPFHLLFGHDTRPRRNLLDLLLTPSNDNLSGTSSTLKQIWSDADTQQHSHTSTETLEHSFASDDLVLLKNRAPNMLFKFLGPYQITSKRSNSSFNLKSIIFDQTMTASTHDLIPFLPNVLNNSARRLAASDFDEFIVEDILDHTNDQWYLVKFSHGPISWQPLSSLRDGSKINSHLRDYVTTHGITIPPRERKKRTMKKKKRESM